MEKIGKHQLFCMIMMCQIGSTNLWALGIDAKQDAWIVILLSMLISLGFILIYTQIQSEYPNENFVGITQAVLGKIIGWPLAFIYFMLYVFNCTRNVSEFGNLINMTFLQDTPSIVIMLILFATMIYILFLGIETLARVTEIILPVTLLLIVSIYIMVIASGRVDIKELEPVLGNGIKPVLKASFPVVVNFPFGMIFIFFQIFPHVSSSSKTIRRTIFSAVVISGLLLSFTLIIIVTTLGPTVAANSTIPFLEVIKLINVGGFITNIDAIGVILIYIGGFYLAILNLTSAVFIFSDLFKIKNYKWVLFPVAAFILWYTGVYEPNYPFHVKYLLPQYWQQFVPLYNIIPCILFIIILLKKYIKSPKRKSKH